MKFVSLAFSYRYYLDVKITVPDDYHTAAVRYANYHYDHCHEHYLLQNSNWHLSLESQSSLFPSIRNMHSAPRCTRRECKFFCHGRMGLGKGKNTTWLYDSTELKSQQYYYHQGYKYTSLSCWWWEPNQMLMENSYLPFTHQYSHTFNNSKGLWIL